MDNNVKQIYFHFQTRALFKKHFLDTKKRFDGQFVFLFWAEDKFEFRKIGDKFFVGEKDINAINLEAERNRAPWSKEDFFEFERYENKLQKIEGFFWNNFFSQCGNLSLLGDRNYTNDYFGNIKVFSDNDLKKLEILINKDLGKIKNLNLQQFILFLEYQSDMSLEWILEEDKPFSSLIKELFSLINMKKINDKQKNISVFKDNLLMVGKLKFVSIFSIIAKNESDMMSYLISTKIHSNILGPDFFISIIKIDNSRLDFLYWNKTGKKDSSFKEWESLFIDKLHNEKTMNIFFLGHVDSLISSKKIPNFYIPYTIWKKYGKLMQIRKKGGVITLQEKKDVYVINNILMYSIMLSKKENPSSIYNEEHDIWDKEYIRMDKTLESIK